MNCCVSHIEKIYHNRLALGFPHTTNRVLWNKYIISQGEHSLGAARATTPPVTPGHQENMGRTKMPAATWPVIHALAKKQVFVNIYIIKIYNIVNIYILFIIIHIIHIINILSNTPVVHLQLYLLQDSRLRSTRTARVALAQAISGVHGCTPGVRGPFRVAMIHPTIPIQTYNMYKTYIDILDNMTYIWT